MTVFQCGDRVIYGAHGVCSIAAIEKKRIDKKFMEYYVLEPVDGSGSRYFVPTQNEAAVSKLRHMLSGDQVRELLASDSVHRDAWIEDEGLRKQHYKELIGGDDRAALVSMIHSLYKHREQQAAAGRKFHLCDENFLRDAEKLLGSEFALALGIPERDVGEVVKRSFE